MVEVIGLSQSFFNQTIKLKFFKNSTKYELVRRTSVQRLDETIFG